ncbi:MAG: hypothetical protein ACK4GU_12895 [Alishewanella aestuarii]
MKSIVILGCLLLLLSGCASKHQGAAAWVNLPSKKLFSNNPHGVKRAIEFCNSFELNGPVPLKVNFDCLLSKDEILIYERAFTRYHLSVFEHFNASMLAEFIQFDKALCISLVHRETRFTMSEPFTDCIHLYRSVLPANKFDKVRSQLSDVALTWQYDPEQIMPAEEADHSYFYAVFALDNLYKDIARDLYPLLLHEFFHFYTLSQHPVDGRFNNLWINEYLAATLDDILSSSLTQIMAYHLYGPVLGLYTLVNEIETYEGAESLARLCQNQLTENDIHRRWQQGLSYSNAISYAGSVFSHLQRQVQGAHLKPLYAYHEFSSLAEPGMGFDDLIARIPACNPDKVLPVHAFKQQLLDYDFDFLLTKDVNDIAKLTGFEQLLRQLWLQQWDRDNPFSVCAALGDDHEVQQMCTLMIMDMLFWQQLSLVDKSFAEFSLPDASKDLQPRLTAWLEDTTLLSSSPLPLTTKVDYLLAQDGRFRNSQQQVADTGAGLNVWPGDTDCELSGEQLVTTLAGQTVPLQRCRLQEGLGVLWRKDGQTDQVIGLPTLVAQQARLVRDQEAMHYSVSVPYVFQDGFVVFQQMDHQVRLNICLDTGSPWSYITRRYRERYQLTPTYLAARLEAETELGELPRRVVLPILGAQRKVRVLPHAGFMQCDLIMGSDLLEQYSAIELGANTLKLWYAQEPETMRSN